MRSSAQAVLHNFGESSSLSSVEEWIGWWHLQLWLCVFQGQGT